MERMRDLDIFETMDITIPALNRDELPRHLHDIFKTLCVKL